MLALRSAGGRGRLGRKLLRELSTARAEIRQGRFQRGMEVMAIFAAVVTGFESYTQHLRGAFSQWLMWTPALLTLPMVLVAGAGLFREWIARRVLPIVSLLWLVDGVVGFAFHLRGIGRLPGGYKLGQYNLVMGPPVFAPLLACTVGILGLLGSMLRRGGMVPHGLSRILLPVDEHEPLIYPEARWLPEPLATNVAYGRFQQGMALVAAFSGVLAGGEACLEHLRGSFNQRFMWVPVWVTFPMVIVGVLSAGNTAVAHRALPVVSVATFLVGALGFLLHLRGIKEMPGGTSTLRFAITLGPPAFAPLLFSSTGLLGFIASLLQRRGD